MAGIEELRIPLENISISTSNSGSGSGSFTFSCGSSGTSSLHRSRTGSMKSHQGMHTGYSDLDGSLNSSLKRPQSSIPDSGSFETDDSLGDYGYPETYKRLVDLDQVPWSDNEVSNVIKNGKCRKLAPYISLEIIQKLSYLLQRPLVRIVREAQRLSGTFGKCTRHEIQAAIKIILSRNLAEKCISTCKKAGALFSMSTDHSKQSKNSCAELLLSVGKFHRWMVDAQVSLRVHELAAVYLTACIECLLEETIMLSLGNNSFGNTMVEAGVLDYGISSQSELWGIYQPWEHLVCARDSSGSLSLPSMVSLVTLNDANDDNKSSKQEQYCSAIALKLEESLLATCVGSIADLGELVGQAMHYWYNQKNGVTVPRGSSQSINWGPAALHTLYHYMKCTQLEHSNPCITPPSIHITSDRTYACIPPLIDWIRSSMAYTEYRLSSVVDSDDVYQAARVLLPNVDCPPRQFSTDESLCTARHLDATTCATKFQEDVAFRMLACGRSDLVTQALVLLGSRGVNAISQQGLTPLMYACMRGDEAMVHILIKNGANVNIQVPSNCQYYPCVHPEIYDWAAISFATAHGHINIVQLLLEKGANVEGIIKLGQDNFAETPLQLAAMAGHYELVTLLLSHGADPYLLTYHKNGLAFNSDSIASYNTFSLAASHGHRNVLSKLLTHPVQPHKQEVLSLADFLAEENQTTNQAKLELRKMDNKKTKAEEDFHYNENQYVCIEDVIYEDIKFKNENDNNNLAKYTKQQIDVLQDAMYNSSENGYLDMTMELRSLGIQWNIHTWTQCMKTAITLHRKPIALCLLKDFVFVRYEENKQEFLDETVPLMFDLFRDSHNDALGSQLANILTGLFGHEPIPPIKELKPVPSQIDTQYVNSPEMSDVNFLIEGQLFYAHKIILVSASDRFQKMLTDHQCHNGTPCIEINDIRYHIFKLIMVYLYSGHGNSMKVDACDVLELLGAAHFFQVEGLQRHCEVLCSYRLTLDNCLSVYKHAKMYQGKELQQYCLGFFLKHFQKLLASHERFRRMAYSSKVKHRELLHGMRQSLCSRLKHRSTPVRISLSARF